MAVVLARTQYSGYKTIKVDFDGPVAIVTLNRPEARNTLNYDMRDDIVRIFREMDRDDDVRAVVMTGAPNKGNAFCAGADLAAGDFSPSGDNNRGRIPSQYRDRGGQCSLAIFKCRKPTIAAINGHAVGIGITFTLPCDIRMAWQDAKIGFVFGRRGIPAEAASTYFLPRLIGHSRTLELLMTARVLPASHPSLNLLFSALLPTRDAVLPAALSLAHEIASSTSAISAATNKALVWRGLSTPEEQHLLDSRAMHVLGNGADSKEGVKAFLERRDANFSATVPKNLPTDLIPWWVEHDVRDPKAKL